jgi:hypothetical protein
VIVFAAIIAAVLIGLALDGVRNGLQDVARGIHRLADAVERKR